MTEIGLGPKVAFPKGEDPAMVFWCMFWGVVLTGGSNFQSGVLVQRLTLCSVLLYLVVISVLGRCLGNIVCCDFCRLLSKLARSIDGRLNLIQLIEPVLS